MPVVLIEHSLEDGTPGLALKNTTGAWHIENAGDASNNLEFEYGIGEEAPASKMVIKTNGKVGIGTSTPSHFLHVYESGVSASTPEIVVEHVNSNAGAMLGLYAGAAQWGIANDGGSDNHLEFDYDGSEKMVLKTGGNVGIGTTTPSEKLEVNGNVKATAFIGDGSQLTGIGGFNTFLDTMKAEMKQDTVVNASFTTTTQFMAPVNINSAPTGHWYIVIREDTLFVISTAFEEYARTYQIFWR
jgi:hypothetical protein